MIEDPFINKYLPSLKEAKTDEEFSDIIDKIYESGFVDGVEEGRNFNPNDY